MFYIATEKLYAQHINLQFKLINYNSEHCDLIKYNSINGYILTYFCFNFNFINFCFSIILFFYFLFYSFIHFFFFFFFFFFLATEKDIQIGITSSAVDRVFESHSRQIK